jgi:molybdate transport system substrate-binding protein
MILGRLRIWLLLSASLCALLSPGASPTSAGSARTLTVFAAVSLTGPFTVLGKVLEQRAPGLRVAHGFAGSQQLAAQIEQGARADVFASADRRWMAYLQDRGRVAGTPSEFARNRLVIITPRSNPARLARLQDLANPGVKVVLAADAVPAGRYSRDALEKLGRAPGFPPDYAQRVLRNVVSQEENVRGVVAKVQLGEADAGFVYQSDAAGAAAERIRVLDIPAPYNAIASYPIAVLKTAPNPWAAAAFVRLLLSPFGQQVLRDHRFVPVLHP